MSQDASTVLTSILFGELSTKAQGFIISAPRGYRLEALVDNALKAAYGTTQHPDIRKLSPDGAGNMIKVDQVRDCMPFLVSSPSGEKMKTLVLYQAHRMNPNSQNALLKPLEEPTRHTRILLVTDQASSLLPTIRSRCALHSVSATDALASAEVLLHLSAEDKQPPAAKVASALALASGDPSLAARIIKHDLEKWLTSVTSWLSGTDPTPPLPVLAGKSATPLLDAGLALQALMLRTACDEVAMKGWTSSRAAIAAWKVSELMGDAHRAGIDAKTRLHSLLCALRATPRP